MWDYTEKVVDHFLHPRNVGEIENPDGVGEVGSLACGDLLKLSFNLGSDGKISDAKFKTFGCASAIASSSALTEMLKGKTIEEAEKITNKDIAVYLGGLPDEKMHCSVMGREALDAAIENYHGEKSRTHQLKGNIVCKCFGVTEEEIKKVARENGLQTIDEITNYTKAGGGCGECRADIQKILDSTKNTTKDSTVGVFLPADTSGYAAMNHLERIHLIEKTIEERVRPALRHDHGNLELIDISADDTVHVRLTGACATCSSSTATLKRFVEKEMKKLISPDIKVQEG